MPRTLRWTALSVGVLPLLVSLIPNLTISLVLAAFILRWSWAMATYALARNINMETFAWALTIDATAVSALTLPAVQ